MLHTFFESLYNKVFVNIVKKSSGIDIYVELCSKKAVIEHHESSFETTKFDDTISEFIGSAIIESPYHYVSILDYSKEQGALPTCDKQKLSNYCDLSTAEYKCSDENWSYYTSKTDLNAIEKEYKSIGVDMVFSPFSILANFFQDKIASQLAMYVLVQESSLALMIFKESQLLYGAYKDISKEEEMEPSLLSEGMEDIGLDDGIDLDDVDVDDEIEEISELDDLDDFADIEDLDEIEDIDEFSKSQDVEEELFEAEEHLEEPSSDGFNEDYERFGVIKKLLGTFYNDALYESQFIENVYIADAVGVTSDLKHYLEEEMFLNVYVRHMDINRELAEIAKMEIEA